MNYERELGNVNVILPENSGFPAVLHSALVTLPDESSVPGVTPVGLVLRFVAQKIPVKSDLQIPTNFSAKVSCSTFASYPFSAPSGRYPASIVQSPTATLARPLFHPFSTPN